MLWTTWGQVQFATAGRGRKTADLFHDWYASSTKRSWIHFALLNCCCFRPKWTLPRSGTNDTILWACAMDGLGHDWFWEEAKKNEQLSEMVLWRKGPRPACGINFSLPPKLSKDCFSPLEGWWVKQQQNPYCALSSVWLNFSQRTSFHLWPLCLSLVKQQSTVICPACVPRNRVHHIRQFNGYWEHFYITHQYAYGVHLPSPFSRVSIKVQICSLCSSLNQR